MPQPTNDQPTIEVTAAAEAHLRTILGVPALMLPSAFDPREAVGTDQLLAALAITARKYAMLRLRLLDRLRQSAEHLVDHARAQARIAADGNVPIFISPDPVLAMSALSARIGMIDDVLADLAVDLVQAGRIVGRVQGPAQ